MRQRVRGVMSAQNHRGHNRHHRQHAGRERQADAGPQKEQQIDPDRAFVEIAGNFVDPVLTFRHAGRAGFARRQIGGNREGDGQERDFRWVADALAGAALIAHRERQREWALAASHSHWPDQRLCVDFCHAEIGVVLLHPRHEFGDRDFYIGGNETGGFNGELVAVEVVTRLNIKADLDPVAARCGGARFEGQVRRQETITPDGRRKLPGCGGCGPRRQQAAGEAGEQGDDRQQSEQAVCDVARDAVQKGRRHSVWAGACPAGAQVHDRRSTATSATQRR